MPIPTGTAEPEPLKLDPASLREAVIQTGLADHLPGTYQAHYLGRFSNDIWRLDMIDGPPLIAKRAFRSATRQDQPDIERRFYRSLSGQVHDRQLAIPRYLGEQNGVLLLEYQALEPFSFRDGVSHRHAALAIDALADWHATWWGRTPEEDWLPRLDDPLLLAAIQRNYDAAWQQHGKRLLQHAPEFRDIGESLVGRLAATLRPLAEPATLIHGDAHAENLPLTETGKVLMLDWQEPRIANPGYDLAVFTSMSFRHEYRRAIERELVERHSTRVAESSCHWPDPWRDYRLGLLRRAARIVEIAAADFPSLPWVFRRAALAAVEQEVGTLIR